MRDLETVVAENNALADGGRAAKEGRSRDCPIPPYKERQRLLWFRGYDERIESANTPYGQYTT